MTFSVELQLHSILRAQAEMMDRLRRSVDDSERSLSDVADQAAELRLLEALMDEVEGGAHDLPIEEALRQSSPADVPHVDARQSTRHRLSFPEYRDWASFVTASQAFTIEAGLDPLGSLDVLLGDEALRTLRAQTGQQYRWDRWDYAFVGTSALLATLTDVLLVRIPKAMPATSSFAGQAASPITEWLRRKNTTADGDWFSTWARDLEVRCKVPYDAQEAADQHIPGMSGRTHRFQSLGHDPVLGFVLGVLDLMRGTVTGFSYDRLTRGHTFTVFETGVDAVGLTQAVLCHLGHLVSDIATPQGLPAPLMPLVQTLNVNVVRDGRTLAELARYMYLHGYDLRHFLSMGITPAVIEVVLRAYVMLRHYFETGAWPEAIGANPKYRSMLLAAHAMAAVGNAGKICLLHGNPLAFNEAQWVAVFRYLLPWMKYQLFDRQELRLEQLCAINDAGWSELLVSTRELAGLAAGRQLDILRLG